METTFRADDHPRDLSTLVAHFNATDGTMGIVTAQAVVNGVLYASDAGGLEAYSANGGTDCSGSPLTCAPMWSYTTGSLGGNLNVLNSNVAVLNGVVYASTASGLKTFDAAGQKIARARPLSVSPCGRLLGPSVHQPSPTGPCS